MGLEVTIVGLENTIVGLEDTIVGPMRGYRAVTAHRGPEPNVSLTRIRIYV